MDECTVGFRENAGPHRKSEKRGSGGVSQGHASPRVLQSVHMGRTWLWDEPLLFLQLLTCNQLFTICTTNNKDKRFKPSCFAWRVPGTTQTWNARFLSFFLWKYTYFIPVKTSLKETITNSSHGVLGVLLSLDSSPPSTLLEHAKNKQKKTK